MEHFVERNPLISEESYIMYILHTNTSGICQMMQECVYSVSDLLQCYQILLEIFEINFKRFVFVVKENNT